MILSQKIKSGAFSPIDCLNFDLVLEILCKTNSTDHDIIRSEDVLKEASTVLKCGKFWRLNPTSAEILDREEDDIDVLKLIDHLEKTSLIEIKTLDKNNDYARIIFPVKIMMHNAQEISESTLNKSLNVSVQTILGKITL